MIAFAQMHPLLVPFAVALLVTGVVFEFYGKLQNEDSARTAGEFNIGLGLAFAVVAAAVGILGVIGISDVLSDSDSRIPSEFKPRLKEFLSYHILFASSTVVIFILALIARRYRKTRWGQMIYFSLLGVGLVSVLATGYCGGELVHRFGLPEPVY